jgi:hypothetical protein
VNVPSVGGKRLFSDLELNDLATPTSIHLESAAFRTDGKRAETLADTMDDECVNIYDAYVTWASLLQDFIIRRAGERAQENALLWLAEYAVRPFVRTYEGLGCVERIRKLAMRFRASGSTFEVQEDADRVLFILDPWGPMRWWRGEVGWEKELARKTDGDRITYPSYGYFDAPGGFRTLEESAPALGGRAGIPCFLAMEFQFLETVPIELFGAPLAVVRLGEAPVDPVTIEVHKNPGDVPDEVFDRLGLVRHRQSAREAERPMLFTSEERERLATPLSLQVRHAAAREDWATLAALSRSMDTELVNAKDPLGVAIAGLLSWIARHIGEAAVAEVLTEAGPIVMGPFMDPIRGMDTATAIPVWCNTYRAHGSTFWIEEQEQTMLFRGRPLLACHRMWSSAYQTHVARISPDRIRYPTFDLYRGAAAFHRMRDPSPEMTHSHTGYPVYSCHCHMLHEVFPIEELGHPLWVEDHPLDDPDGEMRLIHYKDVEKWPDKYYSMVGKSKSVA